MQVLYRFIFLMTLAVFAMGGTAMAVSPEAEMQQSMTQAMPDCDDCADDSHGPKAGCELVCASPLLAEIHAETIVQEFPYSARLKLPGADLSAGLRNPPDPFPPKYLI